jgi:polyphenol oxidase
MVIASGVLVERQSVGVTWCQLGGIDDGSRLLAAVSTRHGGVSHGGFGTLNLSASVCDDPANWRVNRERLFGALDVEPDQVSYVRQVHGTRVVVGVPWNGREPEVASLAEADAQMTNGPGVCLFLTFADCVPLVLFDPVRPAVGLAHAGWRGTIARIGVELVRAMETRYGCDPRDLRVAIGPSIGPCCYEVGEDVAEAFESSWPGSVSVESMSASGQRRRANLWEANRRQLVAAGVLQENVYDYGICTACNVDRFFSHRGQSGAAGRFAVLAMLR